MHGVDAADELASAMAAAAEDTLPEEGYLEAARRFATVIWDRFSLNLLNATERQHEQFVHLIHELEMDELALKIADRLKVCHSVSKVITAIRIKQGSKILHFLSSHKRCTCGATLSTVAD